MKIFKTKASVKKLKALQDEVNITKSYMLLCRLPFNLNKEIPESMSKVFVEYKEGKYDHYALYDDDEYFMNLLCQYHKIDAIWVAVDFDGTYFYKTDKPNGEIWNKFINTSVEV